jgi:hypothetical protein
MLVKINAYRISNELQLIIGAWNRDKERPNWKAVAVGGMEHAGARLAALGPSCIYRPRPPYF